MGEYIFKLVGSLLLSIFILPSDLISEPLVNYNKQYGCTKNWKENRLRITFLFELFEPTLEIFNEKSLPPEPLISSQPNAQESTEDGWY